MLSSLRRCSALRNVDDKTPCVVRLMPNHVRRLSGQFEGLAVSGDTFQAPTGEDQSHIVSAKNLIDLQLHAALEPEKPAQRSEERRVGKECRTRWAPNDR